MTYPNTQPEWTEPFPPDVIAKAREWENNLRYHPDNHFIVWNPSGDYPKYGNIMHGDGEPAGTRQNWERKGYRYDSIKHILARAKTLQEAW